LNGRDGHDNFVLSTKSLERLRDDLVV
jgi:hypothetical protein